MSGDGENRSQGVQSRFSFAVNSVLKGLKASFSCQAPIVRTMRKLASPFILRS